MISAVGEVVGRGKAMEVSLAAAPFAGLDRDFGPHFHLKVHGQELLFFSAASDDNTTLPCCFLALGTELKTASLPLSPSNLSAGAPLLALNMLFPRSGSVQFINEKSSCLGSNLLEKSGSRSEHAFGPRSSPLGTNLVSYLQQTCNCHVTRNVLHAAMGKIVQGWWLTQFGVIRSGSGSTSSELQPSEES
jgi:hypothetical protein